VRRIFGTIRSVINLTMREQGIDGKNAFANTYMPERDDKKTRQPVPVSALCQLQQECMLKDDEARWLIALVSDTGMRLAEAAGLLMSDIEPFTSTPHLIVSTHRGVV